MAVHIHLFGLTAIQGDDPDFVVIEGGARGADRFAAEWARAFGTDHERYPADWNTHGKAAGAIRNQRMLSEGVPDYVVAFKDGFDATLSHGGTEHMVKIAKAAGVPVYLVSHGG